MAGRTDLIEKRSFSGGIPAVGYPCSGEILQWMEICSGVDPEAGDSSQVKSFGEAMSS